MLRGCCSGQGAELADLVEALELPREVPREALDRLTNDRFRSF
jgi:hypothetical protein